MAAFQTMPIVVLTVVSPSRLIDKDFNQNGFMRCHQTPP